MAVNLKTKLMVIKATEALVSGENRDEIRLRLSDVYWTGWHDAPLFSSNPKITPEADYLYVDEQVLNWLELDTNEVAGSIYRPQDIDPESLEALRDSLADVTLEEERLKAALKVKQDAFDLENKDLIAALEGVRELKKLDDADARVQTVRLHSLRGGDPAQKKVIDGLNVEFKTEAAPYDRAAAIQWAIAHHPELLTLNEDVVDSFVLALASQDTYRRAMAAFGCPILPIKSCALKLNGRPSKRRRRCERTSRRRCPEASRQSTPRLSRPPTRNRPSNKGAVAAFSLIRRMTRSEVGSLSSEVTMNRSAKQEKSTFDEAQNARPRPAEGCAVVSLIGQKWIAGIVRRETQLGMPMVVVEVPETANVVGFTVYYHTQAIFKVQPCLQAQMQAAAEKLEVHPFPDFLRGVEDIQDE